MHWLIELFKRWLFGDRPPPPPPVDPMPPTGPVEGALLRLHNDLRRQEGVDPLTRNGTLEQLARSWASHMAERDDLSHGSGADSLSNRLARAGYHYTAGGENIARGLNTVEAVMKGWRGSPSHYRNMVSSRYQEVGFGKSGNYWCATFGSSIRPTAEAQVFYGLDEPAGLDGP